ncbi:OmpA/MotB family protein [Calycomorphotria hydatis]|uniref:Motility protein B n=1 Tax=Calycomorphotria hydatis TaxID=2528027 RepID=A0A517TB92_9PLAN|nr:flagellar motor protein MotB [Calycomorphotria hydatis]QDT65640.1 Motility protein B [Calycomorphotria hydatis]
MDDDAPPGVPEWVVTYGDMMSLLLTFFIMLVSMSELKEEGKLRMMLDALQERFGVSQGIIGVPGPSMQRNSSFSEMASKGIRSEGGLKKASVGSDGRGGAYSTVKRINHGHVVTIGGPATFPRFEATPSEPLKKELDILADVLRNRPNHVVITGHTSPEPLPMDSSFEDRWELAFRRADAVAKYLISRGIEEERIVINSAADTEPRLRGKLEAQNANRRVDVYLIESYITSSDSDAP